MPPLTMRGRYLMREYWSDSDLFLRLDAAQRELYVGLWMLADDEGWLPRDIQAIAASLYRYEDREPRETFVIAGITTLKKLGKLVAPPCRRCLFIDVVNRYPRAGKRSSNHLDAHRKHSNEIKAIRSHSDPLPDLTLPIPDLTLPDVARARARRPVETGGETPFDRAMSASGIDQGIRAKQRERS